MACPAGNIELKATFGRNWTAGSVIGLVLNLSDNHRYDFLLTVPQFDYRDTTSDDLSDLPSTASILSSLFSNRLEMYVLRDGQPLVSRSLTVPEGRLRLLARREGGRLSFTINDKNTIQFEDPFPLSSTEPGVFGLYFPKDVELETMQAMHLRTAAEPSPVERGDELFAVANFSGALENYRRIANPECEYKRAQCLLQLQQTDAAIKILKELFNQPPAEGKKDTPWRLRAGCSLLQHYVESKEWADVDHILDELANYYSAETIARLIPKTQIDRILQQRRRDRGYSTALTRGRSIADDVKWCIRVEELFNVDPVRRRHTKRTLAAVYTSYPFKIQTGAMNTADAAKILLALMREMDKDPATLPYERLEHFIGLHFALNNLGRTDEFIEIVDRWLFDETGAYRKEYMPALVLKAACHWKQGKVDVAIEELDECLQSAGPTSHKDPVFRLMYRIACIIRGMIYEEAGDADLALQTYGQALKPQWTATDAIGKDDDRIPIRSYVQLYHLRDYSMLVLMSWTGQVTEADMEAMWERTAPSTGVVSSTVSRIARTALTPELIKGIVLRALQSPEARLLVRKMVRGEELSNIELYIHAWAAAVHIACLRDLELTEEETKELNRIVIEQCRVFVDAWYQSVWGEDELLRLLNLWRGKFDPKEFKKFINKHPDREFSMYAALVLGNKFELDGKPKVARYIFDLVLNDKDAPPVAVREIKRKLARMERKQANETGNDIRKSK